MITVSPLVYTTKMDMSWIPSGYDLETAFRIDVKIEGFINKKIEGKKDYVKGKTLKWVVDSDRFFLCDLRSDLFDDLYWGSCQTPKIWIFDKNEGREVEVVSESQILEMFRMFRNERKISFFVVVCDLDGSSKCSGTNSTFPCAPSQPSPTIALGSQSHIGSSQGCNMSGQPDQFDNLDEYAGFNEEGLYSSDVEGDHAHKGANHAIEGVHIDPEEDNMDDEPTVEAVEDNLDEEPAVDDIVQCEPIVAFDSENPRIEVNALFPDVGAFRKALRHFAIKNEFEVHTLKSDKKRFIGKCKHPDCPWRIRASILQDKKTFMVKLLPAEHTCPTTAMVDGKMASKSWVSDRVGNWLLKHSSAGAKEVKNKLEEEFHVKVTYRKAWLGRQVALDQIHGKWEESFQTMYNFKAEMEKRCPGSIVEIDCKSHDNKMFFSKIFVALKPCIDGFVQGCRPYLGVDSTHLTGKWKGQLAAAAGIDGHNWLFPVAYAVFDTETTENWTWFMSQLRNAIGTPLGLAISSDACKGLAAAIASVFPDSEHRECMRHLMENFKKRYRGDVFTTHMWPAAKAYTIEKCQHHLSEIKKISPEAITYLEKNHKQLWCRSKFSELSKCEYVNNNISESFNSWIKDLKDLHIVDLVDQIRQRLMVTFDKRRIVGAKLQGVILPNVIKQLNTKSKNVGKVSISRGGDKCAEVGGMDSDGNPWRHAVELDRKECTCREWQISGAPCIHAIAFICSLRGARLEDYVHDYYSLHRFKVAYAGVIRPMTDKSQWIKHDPGFTVYPPKTKRPPGRPRKERIPSCLEKRSKKQHQCKRCKQYGHQERTCKAPLPGDTEDVSNSGPSTNKRKRIRKTPMDTCG